MISGGVAGSRCGGKSAIGKSYHALAYICRSRSDIGQSPIFGQSPEGRLSPGLRVATTICLNCHEVGAGMLPRTALGPKFEDIANLSSTTELSLKVFLHSNHRKMPSFLLSNTDTNDVIAYILGLKRR